MSLARAVRDPDPSLINDDIRPTTDEERHWSVWNMASLWVGMVVCVPTYMLAGDLIKEGMNWWQAVLTIMLGNVIVLVPMVLNGHAGTKYGVPFPVLARASFGISGAHIPALLRGLVACGWFGIQTWVGGSAIYSLVNAMFAPVERTMTAAQMVLWGRTDHLATLLADHAGAAPLIADENWSALAALAPEAVGTFGYGILEAAPLPFFGINTAQLVCFTLFWALQIGLLYYGIESIRILETLAAPFLIAMGLALLAWAYFTAGGFGPMLETPSAFVAGGAKEGQFLRVFAPSLTAMVGFWATLSLNIPDFTRYAKSQRDQILGQAIGLPTTMTLFAFIGVAVTSATVVIFGQTIRDPIILTSRMGGGFTVAISLFALAIATLSTNLAANVVSPANALINAAPRWFTFQRAGYLTAGIGFAILPWKLIATTGGYIYTWLIGYSALLGPIVGILLADYFVLRRTRLDLDDLFHRDGAYSYRAGFNPVAITAFVLAVLPNVPGFLHTAGAFGDGVIPAFFDTIYLYAWFVGFFVAGGLYLVLTPILAPHPTPSTEAES